MPYVYVDSEEVLSDIDDLDLIAECESRGHKVLRDVWPDGSELIRIIYEKRRVGKDYQQELDELIYTEIGRLV